MVVYSLIASGQLRLLKRFDDCVRSILNNMPEFRELCYRRVFLITDKEAKEGTGGDKT